MICVEKISCRIQVNFFFFLMNRRPPGFTLLPHTAPFRSPGQQASNPSGPQVPGGPGPQPSRPSGLQPFRPPGLQAIRPPTLQASRSPRAQASTLQAGKPPTLPASRPPGPPAPKTSGFRPNGRAHLLTPSPCLELVFPSSLEKKKKTDNSHHR